MNEINASSVNPFSIVIILFEQSSWLLTGPDHDLLSLYTYTFYMHFIGLFVYSN